MANPKSIIIIFFLSILPFHYQEVHAQGVELKLSTEEMSATIDSINSKLQESYVFPEVADKMTQSLKTNLKNGKYSSLASNPSEFARQLTVDLQAVSNDKHLSVIYDPQVIAAEQNAVTDEDKAKREDERIKRMRRNNFGFQEIKILDGNIGYLALRAFIEPKYAGETAVSAMNFLSNADALIVDLRHNGGGSPEMIQLITSYFFSPEPVHLNNFYYRPTNDTTQTWTLPYVPGIRRPDIDLYLLTSNRTFSAAEEFSYNLKNLERATLIGETTGGGAHPTGSVITTDKFFVRVPKGRAINPITKTNWEGTGVTPHIQVSSDQALITAQIRAFENLAKSAADSSDIRYYNWMVSGLNAMKNPLEIEESVLTSYVGKYGSQNIIIAFENGDLYYRSDGIEYPLIPIVENLFMLDGQLSWFRIKFSREGDKVISLDQYYMNGRVEKNLKEN